MKKYFTTTILLLLQFYFLSAQTIFEDNFESGSFKSEWTARPNLSGENGVVDILDGLFDNAGTNNSFVVRIGKSKDESTFTTNALDLQLDLSGQTEVELSFSILDRGDEGEIEDGVFFSDDNGNTFVKVLDFFGEDWCGLYGKFPPLDVDELATNKNLTLNNQFVIRFQQTGKADFNDWGEEDGFYLDDVKVYNPNLEYAKLPFKDTFETGFKKAWAWNFADNTATSIGGSSITSPSSVIRVVNEEGLNNTSGIMMGRICDGTFSTNALDLHLDLEGETNVEMIFWIASFGDEHQANDGIYFSEDGGNSFVKVVEFFPEEWCFDKYGQHTPLDVDKLAAKAGLTLSSRFVIRFQQTGKADFNDWAEEDGFYLDDVEVYDPHLEYAQLPFEDNFNSGTFKKSWTQNFADNTSIAIGSNSVNSPMSFIKIVNEEGIDNTPGVMIGRICDGSFSTNALDLHLNLIGETNVEMSFKIAGYEDEHQASDGIYFSDNGGNTFKKVVDFLGEEWCFNTYGQYPPIDIDELATNTDLTLNNQFVIRFQQTGKGDFDSWGERDGFYLDDVKVYNPNLEYAQLPFEDDFNEGKLKKAWAQSFSDNTATLFTGSAPTSPMNLIEVESQSGVNNTYGVRMGRICDGTFTTNALDLHLDLSRDDNIEMTFWIARFYDENQVGEGIYFSDDGGKNFVRVLDFFPEEWCNNTYGQHPPIDIDKLAIQTGLNLSNQFVIRFQQTGKGDFDTWSEDDGFYLDNVKVYNPNTEYANLPFEETFETGGFSRAWAWSIADKTAVIVSDDAITNPMSIVEVTTRLPYNNSTYSAYIGKHCDGTFTTNALDLHLNLLNQTDVFLRFWLADYYDETQIDDGIYLSDNGGESFKKVFGFDFSNTPNTTYELYSLDLSTLAAEQLLNLSDKFVVRFQQRGKGDFSTSGDEDGFYLDDVSVTSMPTSIHTIQFDKFFRLYPNPISHSFNIDFGELQQEVNTIEVIDINGKVALSKETNTQNINTPVDISSLSKGLYFVSVILNNGERFHKKVVKR